LGTLGRGRSSITFQSRRCGTYWAFIDNIREHLAIIAFIKQRRHIAIVYETQGKTWLLA
jgi:hypothetical protein